MRLVCSVVFPRKLLKPEQNGFNLTNACFSAGRDQYSQMSPGIARMRRQGAATLRVKAAMGELLPRIDRATGRYAAMHTARLARQPLMMPPRGVAAGPHTAR